MEVEVFPAPFPRTPRFLRAFTSLAYALGLHLRAYLRAMERAAKGGEGERPMNLLEGVLALLLILLNLALVLGLVLLSRKAGEAVVHPFLGKTLALLLPFLALLLALRLLLSLMGGDVLRKHAAEHQVVHLVERGLPLTLEGARGMPRLHSRCSFNLLGLSFLFFLPLGFLLPLWLALPLSFLLAYEATTAFPALAPLGYPLQSLFLGPPRDRDLEVALAAARALLGEEVSG